MKKLLIVLIVALFLGGVALYVGNMKSDQPAMTHMQNIAPGTENLVTCPVTETKIDPAKAYSKMEYKGKMYYFCCAGCPDEFKKNPEKYVK